MALSVKSCYRDIGLLLATAPPCSGIRSNWVNKCFTSAHILSNLPNGGMRPIPPDLQPYQIRLDSDTRVGKDSHFVNLSAQRCRLGSMIDNPTSRTLSSIKAFNT